MTRIIFIICCILHIASVAEADVQWDTTLISSRCSLTDTSVTLIFPFKNVGDKPFRILKVRPACGCTTVDDLKECYFPGETGVVGARFNVTGYPGWSRKTIDVISDSDSNPIQKLAFNIYVPRVAIQPMFLRWDRDTTPKVKHVRLQITDIDSNVIEAPEEHSGLFEVKVGQRLSDNIDILVKPMTGEPAVSEITIGISDSKGRRVTYRVPLKVE